MASQRGIEFRVGIFVTLALVVGIGVIFIIGNANQRFDESVALYTSFDSVSGVQMGSQVRLSGLKIGVVDKVWIVSKMVKTPTLAEIELMLGDKPKGATPGAIGALPPPKAPKTLLGCQPPKLSNDLLRRLKRRWLSKRPSDKLPTELKISFICVRTKVLSSTLKHIKVADSIAMVKGKGLLGDSLIEISMGVKGKPVVADGYVRGKTPKGLNDFMAEGGEVITSLKKSLKKVESILGQYSDPALSNNLKGIIASVNGVLGQVKTGPGLLHDLFYDKAMTNNVKKTINQLQRLGRYLSGSVAQLNGILAGLRRRGTFFYELALSRKSGKYARQLGRVLGSARRAVDSLQKVLAAPQRKGTLLHTILYKKDSAKIATNITRATDDLRSIMGKIRSGKGTLGALINDPTAFEDFKAILGQVKRSRVLRALIRFVIKRDESVKGGRVVKE